MESCMVGSWTWMRLGSNLTSSEIVLTHTHHMISSTLFSQRLLTSWGLATFDRVS